MGGPGPHCPHLPLARSPGCKKPALWCSRLKPWPAAPGTVWMPVGVPAAPLLLHLPADWKAVRTIQVLGPLYRVGDPKPQAPGLVGTAPATVAIWRVSQQMEDLSTSVTLTSEGTLARAGGMCSRNHPQGTLGAHRSAGGPFADCPPELRGGRGSATGPGLSPASPDPALHQPPHRPGARVPGRAPTPCTWPPSAGRHSRRRLHEAFTLRVPHSGPHNCVTRSLGTGCP